MRLVRRIRKTLAFETEPGTAAVWLAALPNGRAIEEVACIKLHPRLISNYLKHTSADWLINCNINLFFIIKDEVMIITFTQYKLIIFVTYSFANCMRCVEIERSTCDRTDFTCRDHD